MVVLALAVAAALPAHTSAGESPLAAAARKEQERRARTKSADKVLTNDDLRGSGSAPSPAGAVAGESGASGDAKRPNDAGPAGEAADAKAEGEKKEARRDAIQREIDAQAGRIRVVRKQVDDIDRELADQLSSSEGPRRAQIAQRREEGTQFIAEAEARIAELQAEARKLGVTVTRPE